MLSGLVGAWEPQAFCEEGRAKSAPREVRRTIVAFDGSLFKLQTGGDNKQERTYNLTKDITVTIYRRPAKLFDLITDMRIAVQFNPDESSLLAIHAAGPSVKSFHSWIVIRCNQ
jgi:hypothetical protein